MEHWFVYYKLPIREADGVAPRVRTMIEGLSAATGVRGRLMRKLGGDDESATLMETYDCIRDVPAFEAALAGALTRAGLPTAALQARRIERFGDL
jgi:hypothetical protein